MNADWIPRWPPDSGAIRASVQECLAEGQWGHYRGSWTDRLADGIAELAGTSFCRLVSSGSLAVELALRGVGITSGDSVAVCGYDYPGNLRAIEVIGARPLLVDAEADGFSVSVDELSGLEGPQVKAVVLSHLYGVPASIARMRELCDQRGWLLIEDACQVPGMTVDGKTTGSWGDAAALSFGGGKPLTAGCGGAVVTHDQAVTARLNRLLDRPSDATAMSQLQAAALLPQLALLESQKRLRAETLREILAAVPWVSSSAVLPDQPDQATFYKLALLDAQSLELTERLKASGIPAGPGYRSMHRTSDRRCPKASSLERCRQLEAELVLLDHRVLLAEGDARLQLIEQLNALAP